MHMDNGIALANTIINDIYNAKLQILPNPLADKLPDDEENYEIVSNTQKHDSPEAKAKTIDRSCW